MVYGAGFQVKTAQAQTIKWVSLVRAGATTHSCDTEQRLVAVDFTAQPGSLQCTAPAAAGLAPPGWYLLFLTDQNDVPSVGRWVHLV